jgi:hypothetical protein
LGTLGEGDVKVHFDSTHYVLELIGEEVRAVLSFPVQAVKNFLHNLPNVEFELSDTDIFRFLDSMA